MKNQVIDGAFVLGLPRMGRLDGFFASFPKDGPIPVPRLFHGYDVLKVPVPKYWTDIPAMAMCNFGHRDMIGQALSLGWETAAFFEDDARFIVGCGPAIRQALDELPADAHGMMIGGQISVFDGYTTAATDHLSKCVQVERNHAYILTKRGMEAFYECLCESNSIPIDHRWGDLQESGKVNVYRMEPFVAYQAEGMSSISGCMEASRIWDDRIDVRIRKPADVKIVNLVCPFAEMEILRKAGIAVNGGASPPQFAAVPQGRVEKGEIEIANMVLESFTERPEVYRNYVTQMANDTAYHKDSVFALWHPTEVIDPAYPVVRENLVPALAKIIGVDEQSLQERCKDNEFLSLANMMREPTRFRRGLLKMIERAVQPGSKMIEIGSFAGASTEMFLDAVGPRGLVVAIDPWGDYLGMDMVKIEKVFDRLLSRPNLRKIKARSDEVAGRWTGFEGFDLVYIDGDHSYDAVMHDIRFALEKVSKNGWIAGHDYSQEHPDVIVAVNECFDMNQVEFFEDDSWLVPASAFKGADAKPASVDMADLRDIRPVADVRGKLPGLVYCAVFAFYIALALMMAGCKTDTVQVIPVKVQTGSLRNANIAVTQAAKHLDLEPKPSDHVQAAKLLLTPVPDELVESQKSYDDTWQGAKVNEMAVKEANTQTIRAREKGEQDLKEERARFFSYRQRAWAAWIIGISVLIWIAGGALVVFGGPAGVAIAHFLPLMTPFVWLANMRRRD